MYSQQQQQQQQHEQQIHHPHHMQSYHYQYGPNSTTLYRDGGNGSPVPHYPHTSTTTTPYHHVIHSHHHQTPTSHNSSFQSSSSSSSSSSHSPAAPSASNVFIPSMTTSSTPHLVSSSPSNNSQRLYGPSSPTTSTVSQGGNSSPSACVLPSMREIGLQQTNTPRENSPRLYSSVDHLFNRHHHQRTNFPHHQPSYTSQEAHNHSELQHEVAQKDDIIVPARTASPQTRRSPQIPMTATTSTSHSHSHSAVPSKEDEAIEPFCNVKIVNGRFDQMGECWLDEGQKKIHILVETNIHRSHLIKCTVYCEKETNNKRTIVFSVPDDSKASGTSSGANHATTTNHTSSKKQRKRKIEELEDEERDSTLSGPSPDETASNDFCFYDQSWKFVYRCQKGFPVKSGITHSPLRFVTVLHLQPDAIGLYSKCGNSTVSMETSQLTFISSQFFMYSKLPEAVKIRKQKSREMNHSRHHSNTSPTITDQDQSHEIGHDVGAESPRMSPSTHSPDHTDVVDPPISATIATMFEKQANEIKKAMEAQQLFQEAVTKQLTKIMSNCEDKPGQFIPPLQIEQLHQFMLTMSEFGLDTQEERSEMYKLKRMRTESNEHCDIHVQPLMKVNDEFKPIDSSCTTTGVVELNTQEQVYLKVAQAADSDSYWFCMLLDLEDKQLLTVPLSNHTKKDTHMITHPNNGFSVDISQKYLHKLSGCDATYLKLNIVEGPEKQENELSRVITLKLFAIPKQAFQIQRRQNRSQWSIYSVPMVVRLQSSSYKLDIEKIQSN